jgi:murein DD-endopeptidase MepM/ murein hydrolase activator NlpD
MMFLYPLPSPFPISQSFGANPGAYDRFKLKGHNGIDFAAPTGTPVLAAADGWVERAQSDPEGYGLYVQIRHPGECSPVIFVFRTVYGHLSRIDVHPETAVKAGQVIGLSGSTGNSTGPHLHFEIRVIGQSSNGYGGAVNPIGRIEGVPPSLPSSLPSPLACPRFLRVGEGPGERILPPNTLRVITPKLNLRLAPGLDQPIVGGLLSGVTLVRAPGPSSQLDNAEWIPVILWLAKSYQGQPLAEEGSHPTA